MLNFTVGPVMASDEVRAIGAEQVPYFRTAEFSETMKENERLMKEFAKLLMMPAWCLLQVRELPRWSCGDELLHSADKLLVVNGGSFGHRFVQLCQIHDIPYTEIKLETGNPLTAEELSAYEGQGYTGFLVNLHETSTGVLYDIKMISDFCHRNQMFLAVDSISSFLADPFDMQALGVNVMITGSQKALACPPGISVIVLDAEAQKRVEANQVKSMYFDLKDALKNGERGQTPFTPAVGTLLQINARLKEIERNGGVESENRRMKMLAEDFRSKIKDLPFTIVSKSMSNAVTPLHPLHASAYDIFLKLKDEYGIWVCPNGGDMAEKVFRVGHLGHLSPEDNTTLVNALKDMQQKGLL